MLFVAALTLAASLPWTFGKSAVAVGEEQPDPTIETGWVKSKAVAAPEAFQAAAADEKHFYAIASTQVAKYDRVSGKRVAVSQGEAKHLNSGFFWKDELYCAHSNYPQTPEQSEIKLLNVDQMKLSTFKDFGNYGGSLTWAVRKDGHWWCNFAHYGDANRRTFVAKFDGDWREQGRWTYPAALIRQLGRYSLSGGIWDDDHLLVTGHDAQVVYRLRLPEIGDTLELVDQFPIPFTGQGFALDPVTGGLVGINRSRREIIVAARDSP